MAYGTGDFGKQLVSSFFPGCTEHLRVEIEPDSNAEFETSWTISDSADVLLASGDYSGGLVCTAPSAFYSVEVTDDFGDGLCCRAGRGSYKVYWRDRVVAQGGEFKAREVTRLLPGCQHTVAVHVDDVGQQRGGAPAWTLQDGGGAMLLSGADEDHQALCSNATAFELVLAVANAQLEVGLLHDGAVIAGRETDKQDAAATVALAFECFESPSLCCPLGFSAEQAAGGSACVKAGVQAGSCGCPPLPAACSCSIALALPPGVDSAHTDVTLSTGVLAAGAADLALAVTGDATGTSLLCTPCAADSDPACCRKTCVAAAVPLTPAMAAAREVTIALSAGPASAGVTGTFPTSAGCPPFSSPTVELWAELAYVQRTPLSCSSSPCQHGGACVEAGSGYQCDCGMLYGGPSCEWAAKLLELTTTCTSAGCVSTGSFDVATVLPPPGTLLGTRGNVVDRAWLYTAARGDFSEEVAKYVEWTEVDGVRVEANGASCHPDCTCCSRAAGCMSAFDVTADVATDLALDVALKASAAVGSATGCPLTTSVMVATATLSITAFQTLAQPCQCASAGCTCSVQFADFIPDGTYVDIAWLTVAVRGDLEGRAAGKYVESVTVDGAEQLESADDCAVQCDCCAAEQPCLTRVNITSAAAAGAFMVAIKGASAVDECAGLAATVTLGYSLADVDLCAAEPCENGGLCRRGSTLGQVSCDCQRGFTGATCEVCGAPARVVTVGLRTYASQFAPGLLWTLFDDSSWDPVAGGPKIGSGFVSEAGAQVSERYCSEIEELRIVASNMGTTLWGTWNVTYAGELGAEGEGDATAQFVCSDVAVGQHHCCQKGYIPVLADAAALPPAYTCKCAGHLIEVLITPDEYPEEITWSVRSPAAIEDGASSHGR
jgi:hypothetical protein